MICERVTAGMKAAVARGKNLGRPPLAPWLIAKMETLTASTDLCVRQVHGKIGQKAKRSAEAASVKSSNVSDLQTRRPCELFTRTFNLPPTSSPGLLPWVIQGNSFRPKKKNRKSLRLAIASSKIALSAEIISISSGNCPKPLSALRAVKQRKSALTH